MRKIFFDVAIFFIDILIWLVEKIFTPVWHICIKIYFYFWMRVDTYQKYYGLPFQKKPVGIFGKWKEEE